MRRLALVALAATGMLLGAPAHADPTSQFMNSSPDRWPELLQQQIDLVKNLPDRREAALRLVELGTIAEAVGNKDEAFRAYDTAATIMLDFKQAGDFRATGLFQQEANKEWKGETYEKLAAFTNLAMLYIDRDDVGNGLAMLKSAIIADAGTQNQRFKGDFVPAYAMQVWLYNHLGETQNAENAMTGVRDAMYTRYIVNAVQDGRPTAEGELDVARYDLVEQLVLDGLAITLVGQTDKPNVALYQAVQSGRAKAVKLLELKKNERPGQYARLKKKDLASFPRVQTQWLDNLERVIPDAAAVAEERLASIVKPLEGNPNVFFLVEEGNAPRKTEVAMFGSMLSYEVDDNGPATLSGAVDGQPMELQWADSLGFQATSRGGRRMDELNRKKATARAALYGGAAAAVVAGAAISEATDSPVGLIVGAGAGILMTAIATGVKTKADTRDWRSLPNDYYIGTATLEPGEHTIQVGDRLISFTVDDGPTVVHVPLRTASLAR